MLSLLFWNLNKMSLGSRIAQAVATFDVDVLVLAECIDPELAILETLNRRNVGRYIFPPSSGRKLSFFTRLAQDAIVDRFNSPRMYIREFRISSLLKILLATVHFQNRGPWDQEDQTLQATTLARDISAAEDTAGHRRTILLGDFNMNPFDAGIVGAQALHAVMTRQLARKEERIVSGETYRFFYNPMWGHFGDRTPGPAGTFYLKSSKPQNHFWNMYDQVLLRPELMDKLVDLSVLDTDGVESLLTTQGIPDMRNASDHLPILVRLDI
jgi:endonuclease/exonuclease/phosphatase family metal-dependent hydrolase